MICPVKAERRELKALGNHPAVIGLAVMFAIGLMVFVFILSRQYRRQRRRSSAHVEIGEIRALVYMTNRR